MYCFVFFKKTKSLIILIVYVQKVLFYESYYLIIIGIIGLDTPLCLHNNKAINLFDDYFPSYLINSL